jgi:Fe-Mn family superoxide dismutase
MMRAHDQQGAARMISLSRRHLLTGAAGLVAATAWPRIALAQTPAPAGAAEGPFKLPPLPYATDVFEPHIDAKTMEIHHGKHHGAYVANMNNFAKTAPQLGQTPVETVLANLVNVPDAIRVGVRNNLGGHANHTMFWEIMAPNGGAPEGDVLAAIDRDLGGLEKMKERFNATGLGQFGSGWVFVTVTKDGKLGIEAMPNQDTPLMYGKRVLLGNDVWEHAYYLNYQNRRADYLKAWWNVVNWQKIGERYAAAKAGTLTL